MHSLRKSLRKQLRVALCMGLRGPAKSALNTYDVRELDGKIQARV